MSEMAKTARAAMKAKAHRMAGPGSDKGKRIDASGWSEPTDMRTNAPTGMRPVSRRQFKDGGAVSGKKAATRTDRKSRADVWTNRDVRAANHEIAAPHIGGFKDGGATNFRKQAHGMMGMAENMHGRRNGIGKFHRSHKATGGSTNYDDIAGMRPKGDREPRAKGGKTKGKTNIVIAINAGGHDKQQPPMGMMPPKAPPPPPPMAPPQGAGGPPQGMGAPPGMGMPPGMPMPRKSGGRTKREGGGGVSPQPVYKSLIPSYGAAVQREKESELNTPEGNARRMEGNERRLKGRYAGGKVVGAKYPDASASKAENTKSAETMKVGAGGGLGRLAKSSIARKDGFKPV